MTIISALKSINRWFSLINILLSEIKVTNNFCKTSGVSEIPAYIELVYVAIVVHSTCVCVYKQA